MHVHIQNHPCTQDHYIAEFFKRHLQNIGGHQHISIIEIIEIIVYYYLSPLHAISHRVRYGWRTYTDGT